MVQKKNDKSGQVLTNDSEKLKVLWDISHSLHQYINVDGLILHIIRLVRDLIDAEGVAVLVADSSTDELVFTWAADEPPGIAGKLKEVRLPAKQGIAGSVFSSGKAELVPDVAEDPRHYQDVDDITGLTTRSMISVPLKKKDRTVGILQAINKRKGAFRRDGSPLP